MKLGVLIEEDRHILGVLFAPILNPLLYQFRGIGVLIGNLIWVGLGILDLWVSLVTAKDCIDKISHRISQHALGQAHSLIEGCMVRNTIQIDQLIETQVKHSLDLEISSCPFLCIREVCEYVVQLDMQLDHSLHSSVKECQRLLGVL